ncbi:Ribosomal RNA small subunit methyltransferase B [Sandaracinus amylolyticus]|uniref:Ribosomal RNA small subunit methyltransferase B n=1 Tax=Sandaracinus amylolyticus TaxID=927083 RepID=A0A0F6W1Y4_9BACT|nr:Ribosomal RNA small subunit methyltransferase B [Sandaracinus amylolyticus]
MVAPASPARVVATRVLHRIATEGAWASPALDAEIERAGLDARDAALATEIVYGTLRTLPSIDRALASKQTKKGELEPLTRATLRAAQYQLAHLSGAPSHAVVSDAVSIVRAQRGEGLSRFANAVLRALARERPSSPERATRLEVPKWLEGEMTRGLGAERAEAFLRARPLPPPIALRVELTRTTREALATRIREARPSGTVREGVLSPRALLVSGVGDPRALPGWDEGLFAVQDEGSQVVAALLDARAGESIADACAGRGGKTALLVSQVGASGSVTAIDLHERKLEQIDGELARLGLPRDHARIEARDLSVGVGGLERAFDRVLVDAPCTGLGTIHRRPELLLRLTPADPARMGALQLAIARNAAKMVKPGGVLAFAVCSPTRAEGPEVAARMEREIPGLTRLVDHVEGVPLAPDDDGVWRIGPFGIASDEGPDAYQVVRFGITS